MSWCTAMHYRSRYTELHCTMLLCQMHSTTLHCTVQHTPYCTPCAGLHNTTHNCTTFKCISLHHNTLHFTALPCTVSHWIALHDSTPHRTKLFCISVRHYAFHCTAMHCTVHSGKWSIAAVSCVPCYFQGMHLLQLQLPDYCSLHTLCTLATSGKLFSTKKATASSLLGRPLHPHYWEGYYILTNGKATKS